MPGSKQRIWRAWQSHTQETKISISSTSSSRFLSLPFSLTFLIFILSETQTQNHKMCIIIKLTVMFFYRFEKKRKMDSWKWMKSDLRFQGRKGERESKKEGRESKWRKGEENELEEDWQLVWVQANWIQICLWLLCLQEMENRKERLSELDCFRDFHFPMWHFLFCFETEEVKIFTSCHSSVWLLSLSLSNPWTRSRSRVSLPLAFTHSSYGDYLFLLDCNSKSTITTNSIILLLLFFQADHTSWKDGSVCW